MFSDGPWTVKELLVCVICGEMGIQILLGLIYLEVSGVW